MFRSFLMLLLALGLVFQGCSALENRGSGSKEEEKESNRKASETVDETAAIKIEIEHLQEQIDRLSEENTRIRDENRSNMIQLRTQNESLKEEIQRLKEASIKRNQETVTPISKKIEPEKKDTAPSPVLSTLTKNGQKLKIKVLYGDGNIASARQMSKRLTSIGYNIESIGSAPRSDFLNNTIYFEPTLQMEAKELALRLGSNAIIKPLSWPSVFDIIVVTGKNP